MDLDALHNKIENAPELDFGDIFGKSFELFKKTWLQGFVFYIFRALASFVVMLIAYLPLILLMMLAGGEDFFNQESQELNGLQIVIIVLGYAVIFPALLAVNLLVQASYYKMCKVKDLEGENVSINYFEFFKWEYLKKSYLIGFIVFFTLILAMFFFLLPFIFLMVPLMFLPVVFAFNPELEIKELFKICLKLGLKKWFVTFFSVIVAALISVLAGFLMCLVGVYFTQSFQFLPSYHIYKDVIGFEDESEIDEIGRISE